MDKFKAIARDVAFFSNHLATNVLYEKLNMQF